MCGKLNQEKDNGGASAWKEDDVNHFNLKGFSPTLIIAIYTKDDIYSCIIQRMEGLTHRTYLEGTGVEIHWPQLIFKACIV